MSVRNTGIKFYICKGLYVCKVIKIIPVTTFLLFSKCKYKYTHLIKSGFIEFLAVVVWPMNHDLIWSRDKRYLSSLPGPDKLWGPANLLTSDYEVHFFHGKATGEADFSPPSSTEVYHMWDNTSTPLHILIAWVQLCRGTTLFASLQSLCFLVYCLHTALI
jgi:hypothetical protein